LDGLGDSFILSKKFFFKRKAKQSKIKEGKIKQNKAKLKIFKKFKKN
jgi:hypothetical protein